MMEIEEMTPNSDLFTIPEKSLCMGNQTTLFMNEIGKLELAVYNTCRLAGLSSAQTHALLATGLFFWCKPMDNGMLFDVNVKIKDYMDYE